MLTVGILLVFGVLFAAFAVLGSAERSRACERGRVGDPKCEHCPVDGDGAGGEDLLAGRTGVPEERT